MIAHTMFSCGKGKKHVLFVAIATKAQKRKILTFALNVSHTTVRGKGKHSQIL